VLAALHEHRAPLFRYVARLTGDADVAEEVVQETFARLVTRSPQRLVDLRPWLFTVATRLVRDEGRRSRRRLRLLGARPQRQPLGDPPDDPASSAVRADLRAKVRAALAGLPQRDRTVLLLRESGFSHREIAEAVGTTTKSVGTMIARALDRLARELALDAEDV
jgi:RNA polymerase sigma-70 factor (ECF subfamily)